MSHNITIERAMTYLLTWKVFLCNEERPCSWIVNETKHWMGVSLILSCFVHSHLSSTTVQTCSTVGSKVPQQLTAQSISFLNVQPQGPEEWLHLDMGILVI
jgi:hypothetical protein